MRENLQRTSEYPIEQLGKNQQSICWAWEVTLHDKKARNYF